ncbi:MAG: EI24 domain-containing protein [Myxococcales bacterium]|nr:EI24 domain-containing protein [Myxococcales bacterium]
MGGAGAADRESTGAIARFRAGAALVPRALRLLRARSELWAPAAVPALVTAVLVGFAIAVVAANAGGWSAAVARALPSPVAESAWQWLWVGPVVAALWLARQLLVAVLAAAALVAAMLAAALLTSPVLDVLSQRVERALTGAAAGDDEAFDAGRLARDALRSLGHEARRLAFFAAVWLAITAGGFVVPFGPALAPIALAAFAVAYLPLEYAGFALDRRRVAFGARRAWLRAERARTLGFGAAAFAIGAVPGLNFALLPVLVAAGTLLVVERPALAAPPSPRAVARD